MRRHHDGKRRIKKPHPKAIIEPAAGATNQTAVATGLGYIECQVLDVLTKRVLTMTTDQLGRLMRERGPQHRSPVAVLRQLVSRGHVELGRVLARPSPALAQPLITWRPGLDTPDLAAARHAANARRTQPPIATDFICATERAANTIGGLSGRLPSPTESTHDAQLAEVYLWMREQLPTRASSWRSEAILKERRRRAKTRPQHWRQRRRLANRPLPDATVRDGDCTTAIELVGEYSLTKLLRLHHHCVEHGWGYELW